MPRGQYPRKPHTEERKRKISNSLKGIEHSVESRKKMSDSKKGSRNYNWKGGNASKISKHIYVAKNKPKPEFCEECGKKRKLNLASLTNHNYTHNPEDYKWLCYSCHKKLDLKCNFCGNSNTKLHMCMACPNCYKEGFEVWKKLFIKRLKEHNPKVLVGDVYTDFNLIIDKLAGDKFA